MDGVFPGRHQSVQHERRPLDYCSPGRGGMRQNGGTSGGTFHDEMDRCRESRGWTTACSSMPERYGKDQEENSPKQAGLCWFARHSWLATIGVNSYPPGVWFADVISSCSGVTFVLLCFVFIVLLSLKPRALVQSFFILRYACAPTATRGYLTTACALFFYSLEMSPFPNICVPLPFSLWMESTSYVCPFPMVFF